MKNSSKTFRNVIPFVCAAVLTTASALSAAADGPVTELSDKEKTRHEATGVVGGALIGGIVGGPLGAIATAAFGGWVSEQRIAKKENDLMHTALDSQQQELVAMQAEYRALQARYQVAARNLQNARLQNASFEAEAARLTGRDNLAACCSDTELVLHFKSGSARIEPLYDEQLEAFAKLLTSLPEAVIEITGHADRAGDNGANLALSQQRIQAVERKLQSLGVRTGALQTSAFGESRPLSESDNFENNFFDRRVQMRIVSAGDGYLTRAAD